MRRKIYVPERNKGLTVVVPAYNEEQSLPILIERLIRTFKENKISGEIIIVDDGSTDNTETLTDELGAKYDRVKVFHHRRNLGKTEALLTGFENASGNIVAMIDGDLQYAPEDLPRLLDIIEHGYDVVNGWRKHRKDSIFRKIPSRLYNLFSRIFFGLDLHDHNSGLKVFKREVLTHISPRAGQHRLILNLAHFEGYKIGETEIQHFPRKHGKTKYGSSRMIVGLLDLISLRLQLSFMERPMVFFGLSGIILLLLGFIFGIQVVLLHLIYGHPFSLHLGRLLLSVLLITTGIQSFFFGFIAEMIANLRAEQRKRTGG